MKFRVSAWAKKLCADAMGKTGICPFPSLRKVFNINLSSPIAIIISTSEILPQPGGDINAKIKSLNDAFEQIKQSSNPEI